MNLSNMCSSRYEILKILKKKSCTVDDLSSKIEISPTAVRQHLTILEKESFVKRERLKEGIGRPKVIYSITEEAEKVFPKYYNWLAEYLIEEIIAEKGEDNLDVLFENIGTKFSLAYVGRVQGKPPEERIGIVTDILNEWGSYASVESNGNEYLLKNYNCTFYDVAQKYPQVCTVHTTFLEKLLGQPAERTASMAQGNECCAYRFRIE